MKRLVPALVFIYCFAALFIPAAPAEIYKYQDENGNWHFTDSPPENSAVDAQPVQETKQYKSGLQDLQAQLSEKYNPSTPVEEAALATVTIESSIGSGSGFFITENGHILTNKHVIRGDAEQFKQADKALDAIDERLENIDAEFAAEEERLKKIEKYLMEYLQTINDMPDGPAKRREKLRFAIERDRYEAQKQSFQMQQSEYASRKSTYENKKSEYRYSTNTAVLSRSFKVILKDGKELYAHLVSTSRMHDLALLKINGYQTPFIRPGSLSPLRQGEQVYAIGSPVGLRDSMSRGIFSGLENNFIKTDAKIYPGNSGGPLVTQTGKVVGINTFKKLTRNFEGLGFAIPIDVAIDEFQAHIDR